MKVLVLFALAAAAALWLYLEQAPRATWTGMLAPQAPFQTQGGLPPPWTERGLVFRPLARFSLRAVVLARQRYWFDRAASLAPVDIAFGWGPMSEAAVVEAVKISQSGRWYRWRSGADCPAPPQVIATCSANMHLIPADAEVRRTILAVRRHELVDLEGFLVEISAADGWSWVSSLSREDEGAGACEVVWVVRFAPAMSRSKRPRRRKHACPARVRRGCARCPRPHSFT